VEALGRRRLRRTA